MWFPKLSIQRLAGKRNLYQRLREGLRLFSQSGLLRKQHEYQARKNTERVREKTCIQGLENTPCYLLVKEREGIITDDTPRSSLAPRDSKGQSELYASDPVIKAAITSVHQYFLALAFVPTNEGSRHLIYLACSPREKRGLRLAKANHQSWVSMKELQAKCSIYFKVSLWLALSCEYLSF